MRRFAVNFGWGFMLLLALGVTLASSRYLTLNPQVYFPQQQAVYIANMVAITGHVIGGLLALALGPFQFLPRLRRQRWLGIHRWSGRVYLLGITMGGLFGLYVAQLAYGGWITRLGFVGLALFWLYTGYNAYRSIRRGDVQAHKRWMIRNYAATFAAVTLRLWLPLSMALGIDFTLAYRTIAWLCWVPNVVIVEWWLRQRWSLPQKALQYG